VFFRLNPAIGLHWRHWNFEWVVFDVASGNTHQLDELTACALLCLEEAPLHAELLVTEVAAATHLTEVAIEPFLRGAMDQLTQLGLIENVPE
jgi:PqqD family protein of HPr-rel-A system